MRAPLSWIRDFTPIDAPVADIADALNQLGLEVDELHAPGAEIENVVVARILDVVPHPDADKIRLADVDFGAGQLRVVCGAPNIAPGMVVAFAQVGATLPGGFAITKRKIRGVVSEGMLCSARELGLGNDHGGILALPQDAELGVDVRAVLGLDDVIFDLSITPNRPDAMGIAGVARELAAHFGLPFSLPQPDDAANVDVIGDVTVEVESVERCPRFVARIATVEIGESPPWMQRRLALAGMRPISNVVDVTNYVMLERCRPLHAFDLGRLAGRGIVVRVADDGERMTTLDGVERSLNAADLLICDARRSPQAIAGIMGGRDSEVDGATTEILIESAYFEPSGIAKSAKRLGLRSEASARFERGVDPNGTAAGADYAIDLLQQVAAARPEKVRIDRYPHPIERVRVMVRTDRVNAILGTELSAATVRSLIEPLGIETLDVESGGTETGGGQDFVAVCPTWRPDLEREIDIVEEAARRFGLHNIVRTVASAPPGSVGRLTATQRDRRVVADTLVGAGCNEVITLPLIAVTDLETAGLDAGNGVGLSNPLRAEESLLRTSIRPGLLGAAARNAARGNGDVALFEIGTVFLEPKPGDLLPDEHIVVAALLAGRHRSAPRAVDRPVGVGDAIDALHAITEALRVADVRIEAAPIGGLHPLRSARIVVDGTTVGSVGEVDPDVAGGWGVTAPAVSFELDLDAMSAARRVDAVYRPVSVYPPANVDLAFVVADTVAAADVADTLRVAGAPLLESVALFDVFRSEQLPSGHVSLAFAVRFRALDRTLKDGEIAVARSACIAAVERAHDATLR